METVKTIGAWVGIGYVTVVVALAVALGVICRLDRRRERRAIAAQVDTVAQGVVDELVPIFAEIERAAQAAHDRAKCDVLEALWRAESIRHHPSNPDPS